MKLKEITNSQSLATSFNNACIKFLDSTNSTRMKKKRVDKLTLRGNQI